MLGSTMRSSLLLLLLAGAALARDPSVGACTKKEAFAKQQAKIDAQVAKFTTEEVWEKKVRLAKSLTKKYGKRHIEHLIRYREISEIDEQGPNKVFLVTGGKRVRLPLGFLEPHEQPELLDELRQRSENAPGSDS